MLIAKAVLQVIRPKQWVKNILILAAPIASTELLSNSLRLLIALLGFTCASVCGYLINDWFDRESDRRHQKKQSRPFASGALKLSSFFTLLSFFVIGIMFACYYLGSSYAQIILIYLFITVSYTLIVKRVPVLEMFWLALGFLARAIVGSIVIGSPPTGWFLLTIFFGSLFLTSCKRRSEMENEYSLGLGNTRKVLSNYTSEFLDSTSAMFAGVTIITYSLWVLQAHNDSYIAYASIVTFFCALVSYLSMSNLGKTEEPEENLFSNRLVFLMGLLTVIMLLKVFYA